MNFFKIKISFILYFREYLNFFPQVYLLLQYLIFELKILHISIRLKLGFKAWKWIEIESQYLRLKEFIDENEKKLWYNWKYSE
jgi:hypothetical protein